MSRKYSYSTEKKIKIQPKHSLLKDNNSSGYAQVYLPLNCEYILKFR